MKVRRKFLVLVLIAGVLSGCGGTRRASRSGEIRKPEPSSGWMAEGGSPSSGVKGGEGAGGNAEAGIGNLIDLRILPEGTQSHFPAQEAAVPGEKFRSEAFVKGTAIRISHPIPLADPGLKIPPYYLVWGEKFSGSSTIVSAYYQHEVEKQDGKRLGRPQRIPVSFDPDSRRWFIPVLDLFQGEGSQPVSASDLHVLFLDLDLEGGSHSELEIQLQVTGGLIPQLISVTRHQEGGEPTRIIGRLKTEGWAYFEDTIQNPVARSLRLWFRVLGGDFSMLQANADANGHTSVKSQGIFLVMKFTSHFQQAGFRIYPDSRPMSFVGAKSGEWVSWVLGPSEKVKIVALSMPAPGTRLLGNYVDNSTHVDCLQVEGTYSREVGVSDLGDPDPLPGHVLHLESPKPVALGGPPPQLGFFIPDTLL